VWTAAFAQSFANQGLLSIYAHNIGAPLPAGIAFGLSGALPLAWLIKAGLTPFIAYTAMVAGWLAVAYIGAIAMCRRLGNGFALSCMLAALWLCLPMAWMHASYSMLGLGMALLPTYLWVTVRSLDALSRGSAVLLVATAVCAVFMDGYTFVMYVAGAALLCLGTLRSVRGSDEARRRVLGVLAVHGVAFVVAILLYKAYVHGGGYEAVPLSMFRAWGLDVHFALVPTAGEFWFWDMAHLASYRDKDVLYGDASVWLTTFAAPLLVAAAWSAWRARTHKATRWFALMAVLALYLSLGPSLKIDAHKPADVVDTSMPAKASSMSTGSAVLWRHAPGLRLMRAPYRWAGLGYCACWILIVLACGKREERFRKADTIIVALLILMFLPHPGQKFIEGRVFLGMARSIDSEWVDSLRSAGIGPKVAFAPHGNDFLAAYAAARLNVVTFNIGGDKNVEQAMSEWPAAMVNLTDPSQPAAAGTIEAFLLGDTAEHVVIPYVDLLWAAHAWPCPWEYLQYGVGINTKGVSSDCVNDARQRYAATIQNLRASPYVNVVEQPLFAVATLKPAYATESAREAQRLAGAALVKYPVNVAGDVAAARIVLASGWHPEEPQNRWSLPRARVTLPAPATCKDKPCKAVFTFSVFAASTGRPVKVTVRSLDDATSTATTTIADEAEHELILNLPHNLDVFHIAMDIPEATSPAALGVSADGRVLGVSLRSVDVRP
jgi:hypothetical protein